MLVEMKNMRSNVLGASLSLARGLVKLVPAVVTTSAQFACSILATTCEP